MFWTKSVRYSERWKNITVGGMDNILFTDLHIWPSRLFLVTTIQEVVPAFRNGLMWRFDLVPHWIDFMLSCQTSCERLCCRSGYRLVTYPNNKEPCACEGNGARRTLRKINWPDDDIRVAGRSIIGSGIPPSFFTPPPSQNIPSAPPSNPDQAPHCRWTLSHGFRHKVHRSCDAIFVSRML